MHAGVASLAHAAAPLASAADVFTPQVSVNIMAQMQSLLAQQAEIIEYQRKQAQQHEIFVTRLMTGEIQPPTVRHIHPPTGIGAKEVAAPAEEAGSPAATVVDNDMTNIETPD